MAANWPSAAPSLQQLMFLAVANPAVPRVWKLAPRSLAQRVTVVQTAYCALVSQLMVLPFCSKENVLPMLDALLDFAQQDAPDGDPTQRAAALAERFAESYGRLLPPAETRCISAAVVLEATALWSASDPEASSPDCAWTGPDEPVAKGFDAQQFALVADQQAPETTQQLRDSATQACRDWSETKDRRVLRACLQKMLVRPLFGPEAGSSPRAHAERAAADLADLCVCLDGSPDARAQELVDLAARLVQEIGA